VKERTIQGNITFIPVNGKTFNESMITSHGVITGAGFETPAEALYMGKKLMCLPIKGQYEQLCNAESIKRFNVPIINAIDNNFSNAVEMWMNAPHPETLQLSHSTYDIVQIVMEKARKLKKENLLTNLLSEEDLLVMG
jgi:uncharacterized protein (TIGR00661 family)